MKQLTDAERLEIVMAMLDGEQVDEYAVICKALEQDEQARDITDVVIIQRPTECENEECSKCRLNGHEKRHMDCPYV